MRTGYPKIANIYGSHLGPRSTEIELRLLGRNDLLIGGLNVPEARAERTELASRVARLRQLNPRIVVLDFSLSAPYWGRHEKVQPPESCFLHTVEGGRIEGWPGYDMLNFAEPRTAEFLAGRVPPRIDGLGLDGFFVDCMFDHFDSWAVEIESRKKVRIDADGDGKEDSSESLNAAWRSGKLALLKALRRELGEEVFLMVNAQRAAEYAKPFANGNYLEDYVDYMSTINWDWKSVLDLYREWCRAPHQPTCTTINSTSLYWPEYESPRRLPVDECAEVLDRGYGVLSSMRFGLATALMGDGFFGFDLNTRWRGQHWWYAEFDAPLGDPRGEAEAFEDGTWRREFENGFVVVNPQPRRARLKLGSHYRDYTNGWSGEEFSIPARDGRILFPVGSGVPART